MRVAVLADIHGNLPALEAVLDEVDADRIVLLGDIASGPMPVETLDRLAGLGDRAVWVHGNGEREMTGLDERHSELITGLPMTVTLDVDGLGPTLFCHATPRKDDEFVLVDSPVAKWNEVLAGVTEQVVVCGHTHMPFDRLAGGRRVINPGSVGMAYGPPGAYWALLGPTVQLMRTRYDVEAAAARLGDPEWAEEYVRHPHGDDEALEVFSKL
jgi:putative phosphoesterase